MHADPCLLGPSASSPIEGVLPQVETCPDRPPRTACHPDGDPAACRATHSNFGS